MPDGQDTVKNQIIEIRRKTIEKCGLSAMLPVKICEFEMDLLVDTGAAVTIISSKKFFEIYDNVRPKLTACNHVKLQAADGTVMTVEGTATMNIEIGNLQLPWKGLCCRHNRRRTARL